MGIKRRITMQDLLMLLGSVFFVVLSIAISLQDQLLETYIISILMIIPATFGVYYYGRSIQNALSKKDVLVLEEDHLIIHKNQKTVRINYVDMIDIVYFTNGRHYSNFLEIYYIDSHQREKICRLVDHYEYHMKELIELIDKYRFVYSPEDEYGEEAYKELKKKFQSMKDSSTSTAILIGFPLFLSLILLFVSVELIDLLYVSIYGIILVLLTIIMSTSQVLFVQEYLTKNIRNKIMTISGILVFLDIIYIIVMIAL